MDDKTLTRLITRFFVMGILWVVGIWALFLAVVAAFIVTTGKPPW